MNPSTPNPKGPAYRSAYRDAGVDLGASAEALQRMGGAVRATYTPAVLAGLGAFGGAFDAGALKAMRAPVLVASTDGVGTKTEVARAVGRFDSVGADLVNHCVNDILVGGARPLFFLDYVASARLEPTTVAELVGGVAAACRAHAMPLLGGETAEMPGVYEAGAFDLVGTVVGVAERDAILTGERVRAGDVIFGLASGGLQTNGFSLARKVLGESLHEPFEGGTVGEALLAPHRSFFGALWPLLEAGLVRACAHITGGGLVENLPRTLPATLGAHLTPTWPVPGIFALIQARGGVSAAEMYRVFNMGVGFAFISAPEDAAVVQARLPEAFVIGEVVPGEGVRLEGIAEG
jgi:phosphoribosylformylglycinamidine cyclo-ligase